MQTTSSLDKGCIQMKILLSNVAQTHQEVVRQFSKHYDPGYQRSAPSSAQVMNALRAESELDARSDEALPSQNIPSAKASMKDQGKSQQSQQQRKFKTRGKGKYKAQNRQNGGGSARKQGEKSKNGGDTRESWNCHSKGHIQVNCPCPRRDDNDSESQLLVRKRWQNKKNTGKSNEKKRDVDMLSRSDSCLETSVTQSSMDNRVEWILDSASDCHVCTNKDMLSDLSPR
ncbi:unnamed protein product [Phytophthora fragariaefolia]|uniref:Unnamed protein product n=1 Tax=Phytophthora fragariaefolia TaxID=1490495 RepID=A0A9W6YFK2_9STRA|nr:unnamed protein product [Phytophthora fragariaefolia]